MRRIGQPEMPQRIGRKQIAEIVRTGRDRGRRPGEQCQTEPDHERGENRHRKGSSFDNFVQFGPDECPSENDGRGEQGGAEQDEVRKTKPDGIVERPERHSYDCAKEEKGGRGLRRLNKSLLVKCVDLVPIT